VQTGFSYDSLTNATINILENNQMAPISQTQRIPSQNDTFLVGTVSSNNANNTAKGTASAARAMWHFAQAFFQEFPVYTPKDNRVSIWTESYGGKYGPAFTSFFQQQNERIRNGSIAEYNNRFIINLDTLGIINGCIDDYVQALSYAEMAYNNTYGVQAINETEYQKSITAWESPVGCKARIVNCRTVAQLYDSSNLGVNATVNSVCRNAARFCQ
jgi:carboxypeptidase C (cathepsin A)